MDEYLKDLCEEIDATMFSGDSFFKKENREGLKEYIESWQREMKRLEDGEPA